VLARVNEPVLSIMLTATLAPDKACEGVLHLAEEVDAHMLDSQLMGPIMMDPELDTVPKMPLKKAIEAPVVGKLEAFTSATTGELNDIVFVRPASTFLLVVATIICEALDTNV
jgi:hypothetical protein